MSEYVARLCALFPPSLSVVYLCNSGSEANDLALRLAKAYTGRTHCIVHDCAYHGHTAATVELSPYKFIHQAKGKLPHPPHVHTIPTPDMHRWRRTQRSSRGGVQKREAVVSAVDGDVSDDEELQAAAFYAAQLERTLRSQPTAAQPTPHTHSRSQHADTQPRAPPPLTPRRHVVVALVV